MRKRCYTWRKEGTNSWSEEENLGTREVQIRIGLQNQRTETWYWSKGSLDPETQWTDEQNAFRAKTFW